MSKPVFTSEQVRSVKFHAAKMTIDELCQEVVTLAEALQIAQDEADRLAGLLHLWDMEAYNRRLKLIDEAREQEPSHEL